MIETLLGGLLGGAFRLAPEVLKWLDRDRPTRQTTWPGEAPRENGSETEIVDRYADFLLFVRDDVIEGAAPSLPVEIIEI